MYLNYGKMVKKYKIIRINKIFNVLQQKNIQHFDELQTTSTLVA